MIDEQRVGESLSADIFAQIELMKQLSAEHVELERRIALQEKRSRLNGDRPESGLRMVVTRDGIAEFHVSTPVSFYYELEEEYGK